MNLTTYRLLTVVVCALILVFIGCQQEGPAEKAGKKADQTVDQAGKKAEQAGDAIGNKIDSTGASLDDAAITAKIKAEIFSDPLLKTSQIEVTTTGNVVKLNGTVSSQKGIDRAQEIARGVKDVKAVENGLVIKNF